VTIEPVPPRANPALLGQAAAEATLLAAWNSGRLPHAWLLAGPRGIGKATLAFRFARFVLAQPAPERGAALLLGAPAKPASLALGSDHPVFRRVAAGGHADLMVLEPGMIHPETGKETLEVVVGHVRRAIEFLSLTPAEGGWRIVVVDHAEEMNPSAENALLKILEEPHARSLLLLVSHAPGRLLPTIRSRCRRLDMPALSPDILATLLERQAPELDPAQRLAITRLAGGSIGHARELIAAEGLDLYDALLVTVAARAGAGEALHLLADRAGAFGAGAAATFRTFCELAEHLAATCAREAAGAPQDAVFAREAEVVAAVAGGDPRRWLAAWDRLRGLAAAADGINLDRRQTAIAVLTTLREAAHGRGA
jgi:DNA polymerase-3 subunit delta'